MGGKPSKGTKKDRRLKENRRATGNGFVGGRLVPPRKRKG